MDFIKHVNTFTELLLINPLSPSSQCLYHILLYINSKCNWIKEFTVANTVLMGYTGLSRQGLDRARNELKQKNYINYTKGSGNQAGKYLIVGFDTQKEIQNDTQINTQTDNQTGHKVSTLITKLNKLNKTKLNNFYNYIINVSENFENVTHEEKIGIIAILQKLEIYTDNFFANSYMQNEEIEDLKLQYWAIKELYQSPYKVYLNKLNREYFLFKFLQTKKYIKKSENYENDIINYFIKIIQKDFKKAGSEIWDLKVSCID